MAEWNGKFIKDMDTNHIENTIRLLKKQAIAKCKKLRGSDWILYVDNAYHYLVEEFEKRDLNF